MAQLACIFTHADLSILTVRPPSFALALHKATQLFPQPPEQQQQQHNHLSLSISFGEESRRLILAEDAWDLPLVAVDGLELFVEQGVAPPMVAVVNGGGGGAPVQVQQPIPAPAAPAPAAAPGPIPPPPPYRTPLIPRVRQRSPNEDEQMANTSDPEHDDDEEEHRHRHKRERTPSSYHNNLPRADSQSTLASTTTGEQEKTTVTISGKSIESVQLKLALHTPFSKVYGLIRKREEWQEQKFEISREDGTVIKENESLKELEPDFGTEMWEGAMFVVIKEE